MRRLLALALAFAPGAALAQAPDAAALYKAKCAVCHDGRGWASAVLGRGKPAGQGVLADRKGIPAAYVTQVIRKGIGAMPGFTPTELTDAQVAAIAAWLGR